MGNTPPPQVRAATVSHAVVDFGVTGTFEEFYRREMPALVAFARALSGAACAEDLAQDAMLAAYRRWDSVSHFDVPSAWVRRVCANRAVSSWRRGAVEARALLRMSGRRCVVEPIAAEHEAFWTEVRRLPRRQAQVIALRYLYDLDIAGIATTLGCAEGTIKVHLSRGRTALATRFDLHGEVRS